MPTTDPMRTRLRLARKQLHPTQRKVFERAILKQLLRLQNFRNCQNLAIYLPFDGEVDTRKIIAAAWRMRKAVFLPVLGKNDRLRFVRYTRKSILKPNRYGIPEPASTNPDDRQPVSGRQLDLVITPLVGFDRQCQRMGMGGGYYDRTFAFLQRQRHWHRPKLIGLAFELQKLNRLPLNTWDVPLHQVITETTVYSRL